MQSATISATAALMLMVVPCLLSGCDVGVMNGSPTTTRSPITTTYSKRTTPEFITTPTPPPTNSSTTPTNHSTPTGPPTPPVSPTTTTPSPAPSPGICYPTDTVGCLNGQTYDKATQFVCGRGTGDGPAIFDKDKTSCCAQGIPFDKETQFCCYDGVHEKVDEECLPWHGSPPSGVCGKKESAEMFIDIEAISKDSLSMSVNTTSKATEDPCTHGDYKRGCFNGEYYDFSQQMPCGDHIVDYSKQQGCCPTTDHGIMPFSLYDESCCLDGDGKYTIYKEAHHCMCQKKKQRLGFHGLT